MGVARPWPATLRPPLLRWPLRLALFIAHRGESSSTVGADADRPLSGTEPSRFEIWDDVRPPAAVPRVTDNRRVEVDGRSSVHFTCGVDCQERWMSWLRNSRN